MAGSRAASPLPALEAAARSAGTTPDALALSAVHAPASADVTVSGAASVRRSGPAHGPGLRGFTDRVEAVGGTLRIQGRAGRRTGHLVELPLLALRS
jgi:signal transduction histidine kinase